RVMTSGPSLRETIHSPVFPVVFPVLVSYAQRLLRRVGWEEGRDHIPSAAQVEDLIGDAVEACLEGGRADAPGETAFVTVFCNVMRSQMYARRLKERRRRGVPLMNAPAPAHMHAPAQPVTYLVDPADPAALADEAIDVQRFLAEVRKA